jgi:predicted DNA-binding antitoxin AbrB/MazE fold protein
MTEIEAIYQGDVFKPIGEVRLPENQKVRLTVRPADGADMLAWLEGVQRLRKRFIERHGYLPDSTPDIAADRARDV